MQRAVLIEINEGFAAKAAAVRYAIRLRSTRLCFHPAYGQETIFGIFDFTPEKTD